MLEFLFLVFLAKLIHSLFIWSAFFVSEKIALDEYISVMYIDNDGTSEIKPPALWRIPLRVFIADIVVIALIMTMIYLVVARMIEEPIVGGSKLLFMIFVDLAISYSISFIVAIALSRVSQNQTCCRFKDDGLRGIRAYCFTALCVTLVICLPPYYLLV